MNKIMYIVLGAIILIGAWVGMSYNGLVQSRLQADAQWAQVESQYQRRYDLIPNLVSSVQGIMKQETAIFTALAEARQGYAGARTPDEKAQAATQVEGALGRLLVITENYPQLKSSETVQTLMVQLEGTENRISVERMRYNETVQAYNAKVIQFPGMLIAKIFGFTERSYFQSVTEASQAPKVTI